MPSVQSPQRLLHNPIDDRKQARPAPRRSPLAGPARMALQVWLILAMAGLSVAWRGRQTRPTATAFESVDVYVTDQMTDLGIPGAAVVIVEGDRIVHLGAFGVADAEGRPVTPRTPFFTGSTGKSFTALAIMQLVEAGKIELDAPVRTYLPWFRAADVAATELITVRQLLTMTSGFSTQAGRKPLTDTDVSDAAIEDNARALAQTELSATPGERYEYSNANYIVLGMILQAVSGQSYERYIQDHVFRPLDMLNSFTFKSEAERAGLVVGYRKWFGVPVVAPDLPFARGALPAGQLMLSAEDFGHYLIAQLNDGVYREATILSPAGIAALHRPEVAITNTAGSYALGWEVQRYQDVSVVSHNGAVPGFTTGMFLVPEKRLAVAVMLNTYSPMLGTRIEAVPGNVLRLLLGQAIVERHEFAEMQLAYVVLMGIPWLEGVAIVESLRRIRRWHAGPRRPSRARVLSFMLGTLSWTILLAAVLLIVLPNTFDADLPSMVLFQPDVGWAVMLGAAIALLWAAISVWVGLAAWHRTA